MTEREETTALASRILERPYADPDDDLAMLSRQFLRAEEVIARLTADLAEQRRLNLDLSARVEAQCGILARSAEQQSATFGPPAVILYRNWRGETRLRTVKVRRFWFGATAYHPEPGILFDGTDAESGEERTFALAGVVAPWGSAEHPDAARVVELNRQAETMRAAHESDRLELERLRAELARLTAVSVEGPA